MNFGKSSISKKISPRRGKKIRKKVAFTVVRLLLIALLVLIISGAVAGAALLRNIIADAPDISNVALSPTEAATYIYNQEGKRVQKLTLPEANRDLVTLATAFPSACSTLSSRLRTSVSMSILALIPRESSVHFW